jgi:hypothetical protein
MLLCVTISRDSSTSELMDDYSIAISRKTRHHLMCDGGSDNEVFLHVVRIGPGMFQ